MRVKSYERAAAFRNEIRERNKQLGVGTQLEDGTTEYITPVQSANQVSMIGYNVLPRLCCFWPRLEGL